MRLRDRCIAVMGAVAAATALGSLGLATVAAQAPGASSLKTEWGEPDLQGIWANKVVVPLERPAEFGNREFKTDSEMKKAEEDLVERAINAGPGRDSRTVDGKPGIGTEKDVARAYNEFWFGDDLTTHQRACVPGRRSLRTGEFSFDRRAVKSQGTTSGIPGRTVTGHFG